MYNNILNKILRYCSPILFIIYILLKPIYENLLIIYKNINFYNVLPKFYYSQILIKQSENLMDLDEIDFKIKLNSFHKAEIYFKDNKYIDKQYISIFFNDKYNKYYYTNIDKLIFNIIYYMSCKTLFLNIINNDIEKLLIHNKINLIKSIIISMYYSIHLSYMIFGTIKFFYINQCTCGYKFITDILIYQIH